MFPANPPAPADSCSCWSTFTSIAHGAAWVAAVAALALGVISLLAQHHVLSQSYNLLEKGLYAWISTGGGTVLLVALIAYNVWKSTQPKSGAPVSAFSLSPSGGAVTYLTGPDRMLRNYYGTPAHPLTLGTYYFGEHIGPNWGTIPPPGCQTDHPHNYLIEVQRGITAWRIPPGYDNPTGGAQEPVATGSAGGVATPATDSKSETTSGGSGGSGATGVKPIVGNAGVGGATGALTDTRRGPLNAEAAAEDAAFG